MGEAAILMPSPTPRGDRLLLPEVDDHRDVLCRHYEDCLGEAAERNWTSFSCAGCPLKGQAQVKPELPAGGDCVLAEAQEQALGHGKMERARATMASVFDRLSSRPQLVRELAGDTYTAKSVEMALGRLRERGVAATVRLSQGSGVGGGYGWIRTGKRICEHCEKHLPAASFATDDSTPDGIRRRCRPCESAIARERRERDRVQTLARRRRKQGGAA